MHQTVGEANRTLSSSLSGGELRDLGTLPDVLNTYKPFPAVHLYMGRKRLWNSCDLADLGLEPLYLLGRKHLLGCSSWRWTSVLSDLTRKFTSLCEEGGCEYHIIQSVIFRPT
jgi:hypothetical protein